MKIWSIVSQKGGAGKTTVALHLAIAGSEDRKVLVIDLDPQESAERWHEVRKKATGNRDDPSIVAGPSTRLPDMLKAARKLGAELVLIDTPPKSDKAIVAAIRASTQVIIPLKSGILDLQALGDTVELVALAKSKAKAAIILNAVPSGKEKSLAVKESIEAAGKHKIPVLSSTLSESRSLVRGLKTGLGVTETENDGAAAKEVRALLNACWRRDRGNDV